MTDFNLIVIESTEISGFANNPFVSKNEDGTWKSGYISIDFLNSNFGQYTTATDMKANTTSEGLKLFFDDLVVQGKLQP